MVFVLSFNQHEHGLYYRSSSAKSSTTLSAFASPGSPWAFAMARRNAMSSSCKARSTSTFTFFLLHPLFVSQTVVSSAA